MKSNTYSTDELFDVFIQKDPHYEGLFFVGIKTTGIVCKPTCRAKKPLKENVVFFFSLQDALLQGYRPCKLCKPQMQENEPYAISITMDLLKKYPDTKISDQQLKAIGLEPSFIRRWFIKHQHMTFHQYQRAFHVSNATQKISSKTSVVDVAYDAGYSSLSGFTHTYKKMTNHKPKTALEKTILYRHIIQTPLGQMVAVGNEQGLCLLEFENDHPIQDKIEQFEKKWHVTVLPGMHAILQQTEKELHAYFETGLKSFSIPLVTYGTAFQKNVWAYLQTIPYAQTISYEQEAIGIGMKKAVRAVANANGRNNIAIIIPCHRVIGKNGALTGYGAGVWRKQWLLEHELQYV